MRLIKYLAFALLFANCGSEKSLDANQVMAIFDRELAEFFIKAGNEDFYLISREHAGLIFVNDSKACDEQSFISFILTKSHDTNRYRFIKHNDCGEEFIFEVESEAIKFFERNRAAIRLDSLQETVSIDHAWIYSFYEFKNAKLTTFKHFCKECIDWDEDIRVKEMNQNTKTYKFFALLDPELEKLTN